METVLPWVSELMKTCVSGLVMYLYTQNTWEIYLTLNVKRSNSKLSDIGILLLKQEDNYLEE